MSAERRSRGRPRERGEPAQAASVEVYRSIPVIDAHQHFWRVDRGDYGWLKPALEPIYRDFMPEDLAPLLAACDIGQTILVQAAPTVAETKFLLDIAARTPFVAGVVGWVDFDGPDAPDAIARLATDPTLVGLRPMVQDIADDDWLLRPSLAPAFRALIAHGLVFDALVLPRHLSRVAHVLDRHPDLRVVIDHAAKPAIREGPSAVAPWRDELAAVASSPRVHCKLSGMVTEARRDWTLDSLRPFAETVLGTFGTERVLWGSDWPVVNLAGGYDRWRATSLALLAQLPATAQAGVLGGNAQRVYLERKRPVPARPTG